jgi:tryptophan synthase alpha chain
MTGKIRADFPDIPVILFSYYNPIHAYGGEKFYLDAVQQGADGVLIVDLPPEESDELTSTFKEDNFSIIRLIAPTTPDERVKMIAENATGFLYLVSKTGVTGSDGLNTEGIEEIYTRVEKNSKIPVCVGFGISTPDDVKKIAAFADGIVIGSAFERLIEDNLSSPDLPALLGQRVKEYKSSTRV